MNEKKMIDEFQNRKPPDRLRILYPTLLILIASLLASTLTVIYNNSTRSLAVFVFLLYVGIGTMLTLGMGKGVLFALLMISAWVAIKQLLGVWEGIRLLDNLLEMLLVGLTFIFSGLYHNRLQTILNIFKENQIRLRQLDLEDKTIALIKPAVGLLRLNEEEERSNRYRRPFALILALVQPIPGTEWEPNERSELMRAIAANIKDTTRETDIPFLVADDKIAVILPETGTAGANKVVNNIFNRMLATKFITRSGSSMPIQKRIRLRFGFAAFLGSSPTKINMLDAAEESLRQGMETNTGDLFQNLFIEWATVGEQPMPTPLYGKGIS